jgi:phospholipid/cholesterol/gamma-HCH transport system substrate-binding protein
MNERTMRFRIGAFVLASLLLLAALITLFGSVPTLFKRQHAYTVTFQDAPGISPGTPVRRSGVRIGQVSGLVLDDESGEVRVHLLIDLHHTLRCNDQPTLVVGLIGHDASIDLVPRHTGEQADLTPIEPGTIVAGVRQVSVSTLLNRASEVVPTTQDTFTQMRQSLQRFERLAPLMEETLREYRDLAHAGREMVPELRRTNDQVRDLAQSVRESVPGISATSDEVRELAKAVRETVPKIASTSDEVRELAKAVRETVPNLCKTNDEIRELAQSLRETVPQLRRTNDEILATAHNFGEFANHLDALVVGNQGRLNKAVDNLNETLTRISTVFNEENQRNLAALLKNAKAGSENLESVTRDADAMLLEGREAVKKIGEAVARADEAIGSLQQATKPLADRSTTIMKNLDEGSEKFNLLLTEMRNLMHAVADGDGTLKKLATDPSLYNHLDEVALMVARLLPRLDRILHDVELFADKIARHPESLGLGGVVNPGSGVKK